MKEKVKAIMYALLAALFYAINVPISKILLKTVGPISMAALLYLGAGLGIAIIYAFRSGKKKCTQRLTRKDLPYVIGMIVLDIVAPIFLMLGISCGSSANASLLGNFEIVATTVIALCIFKEAVSKKLWIAIAFIIREAFPGMGYVTAVLVLGFVAYGLSIFLYVRAQNILGAAKTSAYYAIAPFVGVFLSFVHPVAA